MRFDGKTIVLGVTGGIAAYKCCYLVSALRKDGADVHVIMTENATQFVSKMTFETLSANRVITDTFDRSFEWEVGHVSVAKKCDLAIIAPATMDIIAKLASGICEDFLTTTFAAMKCPRFFAPAMNTAMYENPANIANMKTLQKRGYVQINGDSGFLACGDSGVGRMAEPDVIIEHIKQALCPEQDFKGKTVLVSAGATKTAIDPVRYITNRSSGKMGYSIAKAAYLRGAKIIYVKGITRDFEIPSEWTVLECETTEQMYDAVMNNVEISDCIIMAAAPCDYAFEPFTQKQKAAKLNLTLKKTVDIARSVGEIKQNRKLIIFAAETQDFIDNAASKLKSKKADLVVANDITRQGAGFDVDTNIVTILSASTKVSYDKMSKFDVANKILDAIKKL